MSREDAVRAAAEALAAKNEPMVDVSPETFAEAVSLWLPDGEAAVAAAEPHLRALIAAEIRAEVERAADAGHGANFMRVYLAANEDAARIAEGTP